jgi:RND superfamily putative drug exporter
MKIPGTQSQDVLDKLAEELPAMAGGQASVVFAVPEGQRLDTPERAGAIRAAAIAVYGLDVVVDPTTLAGGNGARGPQGAQAQSAQGDPDQRQGAAGGAVPYGPLLVDGAPVPGVLLSADGSVALFQFRFNKQLDAVADSTLATVVDEVEKAEGGTGISAMPSDTLNPFEPPIGAHEVLGLGVAAIVLVLTLGSLIAAGLPLVTALIGVGIAVGGAYALSSVITVSESTPVLGLMVGLAVGIDYALFIVNRQRRIIFRQGLSAREAASRAVGTAGSAVFFAGLTVVTALVALSVFGIAFLTTMALVAAAAVLLAVLIALTLLPALLGLVGERVCSPKARTRHHIKRENDHRGLADRWVNGLVRRRWVVIVAVVVGLTIVAVPMADMEFGTPSGASANTDTSSRQSYDAVSRAFGEGFNGPLLVVAETNHRSAGFTPSLLGEIVQDLDGLEGVAMASLVGSNEARDIAVLSVVPESGPNDRATKDLVDRLRSPDSSIVRAHYVTLGVTGMTAINADISTRLAEVFPAYIAIIVVLSLVILLFVFRSIIVPVKATLGFLLSIVATFGLTTAIFQWGWFSSSFGIDTGGPLINFMPIIVTGILYGLAMDYEVFLVSSMRESYVHGYRGVDSVIDGYDQASRVVAAAAVIMVSVFSGFIFADDIMIKQVGFALAAGILIDAFIIRMTLVPAVMAVFNERVWWLPVWLQRTLPNLDVEGDRLIEEIESRDVMQFNGATGGRAGGIAAEALPDET